MVRFGVYHEQMALCHGNGLEVPSTIPLDGLEAPEPAHGAEIPISPLTGASRRIRGVVRSTPWVLVPPDWTLRVPRTILVFSAGQGMQRRASGSSDNRLHRYSTSVRVSSTHVLHMLLSPGTRATLLRQYLDNGWRITESV